MKFTATIRKENAPDETRSIEAPSRFAVYDLVGKEGGTVVTLVEGARGFKIPAWLDVTFGTGIKQLELITLTRNLSATLSAGLSLSRSLSIIERQTSNKRLKKLVAEVGDSISKGSSFHEALDAHRNVFSNLFIAMVRAGEESGSLADTLSIVGLQMDRAYALVRKIRGAMIYPAIVITAIIIVAILMLIFVVPTLTKTFTSLGVKVPLATQIIVGISDFLVQNIIFVIPALIALVISGVFFVRSKTGSAVVLWSALRFPVISELVRETYAARAARTLSSLLSSGVQVLDALAITADVVHAPLFANVLLQAEERVRKGEPLSVAFAANEKLYPILMADLLAVGEETGKVSEMLKQIAEFYEEDVSEKTKDLSTIIEPVLMLLIGAFVGVFAVSMIAPIYSLSSVI